MASATGSLYRPYISGPTDTPIATSWLQVDLGSIHQIDAIKLFPISHSVLAAGAGFPLRFIVEISNDRDFESKSVLVNWTKKDFTDPKDHIVRLDAKRTSGQFVRLTVTRFRKWTPSPFRVYAPSLPEFPYGRYVVALSKMEVLSQGIDVSSRRLVSVDEIYGNPAAAQQITRPTRPQGEGLVTDNADNVTSFETWRPAELKVDTPLFGVKLNNGVLHTARNNNIQYLLKSFSVDQMLRQFRERAGIAVSSALPPPINFWEDVLAGSNAGRFLMGAGTTLQWFAHEELRRRMDEIVDGIAECRQPNGYIMAYPEDTMFVSERGAYTRAWLTHGLIEAGHAGNSRSFELLRGYYDWYNRMPDLPLVLRGCNFGPQGNVANTRVYFTPVGKVADIHVVQRYLQENYWIDDLAARRPSALWQYPYDRPHSYLLTVLESYLHLYRATGQRRYLDAVLGGWELFRENWQYVGGSFSLIEHKDSPPKSYPLYEKRGETCGSAFWILLNHQLHQLDPNNEQYVAEIEKSIYNVILANQVGSKGIRYHTMLVGEKEEETCFNTCCEGQGTRILGSLPEFIYSVGEECLYINLFESSELNWKRPNGSIQLTMETDFPYEPTVKITLKLASTVTVKVLVRTPCWATGAMIIRVNGVHVVTGVSGQYAEIDRCWSDHDVISFELPMSLKMTAYSGIDQIQGRERYALEFGPLLMAAVGAADAEVVCRAKTPLALENELSRKRANSLAFIHSPSAGLSAVEWIPYFMVAKETFSCYPMIRTTQSVV